MVAMCSLAASARFKDSSSSCCSAEREVLNANTNAIFNSPAQTQIICRGNLGRRCFNSAVVDVGPNVFPALFADNFPDPTGLQALSTFKQLEASMGAAGADGRDSWVHMHSSCPFDYCKTLAVPRYAEFVAEMPKKPTASFVSYPVGAATTFIIQSDVVGFNPKVERSGCADEPFKAFNVRGVPMSNISSHGMINGELVYTSLIAPKNKASSVASQTLEVLEYLTDIIEYADSDRSMFIRIFVYLQNIADKSQMDAAYASFFIGSKLPTRVVVGSASFPEPGQEGSKVAMRAIAALDHPCYEPLKSFRVPEVWHESYDLATQAISYAGWVYVGSLIGTKYSHDPATADTNLVIQGTQILANIEAVGFRKGEDRHDMVWSELFSSDPITEYPPLTDSLTSFWNGTSYSVSAFTYDPGTIPYSNAVISNSTSVYLMQATFWDDQKNYQLIPTPYPWAIFGLLADIQLGLPIGTIPNDTYCINTSNPVCMKPGYLHSSYPLKDYNSLGLQGDPIVNRLTGRDEEPARMVSFKVEGKGEFEMMLHGPGGRRSRWPHLVKTYPEVDKLGTQMDRKTQAKS